ncbi:MAG TPA: peptidylprolyl isomerase [Bryobacteraceae bacterium]|nr:peptidylprolyl isomerase [Bryobacteraceae bacterium]
MKFQLFAVFALCSAVLFAQNPPPSPATPPPPAQLRQPPSLAAPAAPVAPDAVVLTIGTTKITRAQFEELIAALAENGRPLPNPAAKRQMAQQFGELMALSEEARKRKLDQTPAAKQMMTIQVDSYLVNALQRQVADEIKPDDASLHAYYDGHKSQYEQIKAKHILIRFKGSQVPVKAGGKDLTEDEALAKAKDIEKQIAAGGDFAAIAKAESDDTGTATRGGELPPFSRGQMVPEFEQAVLSQPIGKVSDPVKTKFGYHIILVDDRSSKSFDEAKADIEKQVKPGLVREAMDKLEKGTPVTLDDNYFGPVIGAGTLAPGHPPAPAPNPAK